MKHLATTILPAIVLLFAGIPAHAFSVDLDGPDNNNATGIRDLTIGGNAYDVVFELAPADTAPVACGSALPCDIFFGNASGAQAAVTAINAALNGAAAITVGTATPRRFDYFVPYAKGAGDVDSWQGTFVADTTWLSIAASLDVTDFIEIARFSPAVIPIPAAVWLFGSALGILGWIRRRTGKTAIS
jgi:hypothetical protein